MYRTVLMKISYSEAGEKKTLDANISK